MLLFRARLGVPWLSNPLYDRAQGLLPEAAAADDGREAFNAARVAVIFRHSSLSDALGQACCVLR